MSSTAIISSSSRKNGDTARMVQQLVDITGWDVIDLADYTINHYDYEHRQQDDFISLMKDIINQYDTLVFATPVYWYAMSGIMKVFFDRFTDLLKTEKEYGRKLRGKNFAAISCSQGGGNLEKYFWLPFKETAAYLGMHYICDMHYLTDITTDEELAVFTGLVTNQ